jgi:hypothetical protein
VSRAAVTASRLSRVICLFSFVRPGEGWRASRTRGPLRNRRPLMPQIHPGWVPSDPQTAERTMALTGHERIYGRSTLALCSRPSRTLCAACGDACGPSLTSLRNGYHLRKRVRRHLLADCHAHVYVR